MERKLLPRQTALHAVSPLHLPHPSPMSFHSRSWARSSRSQPSFRAELDSSPNGYGWPFRWPTPKPSIKVPLTNPNPMFSPLTYIISLSISTPIPNCRLFAWHLSTGLSQFSKHESSFQLSAFFITENTLGREQLFTASEMSWTPLPPLLRP